jgi:aminoglycoside phosphotransferase (APT) family kinase protein
MRGARGGALDAPAAEWVRGQLDRTIVAADALSASPSTRVTRCTLSDGSVVVVRHIVDDAWLAREPDLVVREATALRLLHASDVPVPAELGRAPELGLSLVTWIEGRPLVGRKELRARVPQLAAVAGGIAETPLPGEQVLPAWRSWVPDRIEPPPGAARGLWQAAIAAYRRRSAPPIERPVLLHRDLHPMNVLWRDGVLAGVVDWVNASLGHPHAELGSGRWNLAVLAGMEAAEAYLEACLEGSGQSDYDPLWDLEATLCRTDLIQAAYWASVGRADIDATDVLRASEGLLERALAEQ